MKIMLIALGVALHKWPGRERIINLVCAFHLYLSKEASTGDRCWCTFNSAMENGILMMEYDQKMRIGRKHMQQDCESGSSRT